MAATARHRIYTSEACMLIIMVQEGSGCMLHGVCYSQLDNDPETSQKSNSTAAVCFQDGKKSSNEKYQLGLNRCSRS